MQTKQSSKTRGRAIARRQRAGFTLIEMLTAMAIVSVLATMSVPALTGLHRSSRIASQLNGFLADLRFARSQAIALGRVVSVCASADGVRCAGDSEWQRGWIVFADADGDGQRDATGGEALLRAQPAWQGDDRFVAAGDLVAISFARTGYSRGMKSSRTLLALRTPAGNAAAIRCVAIDLVGHAAVLQGGNPECT